MELSINNGSNTMSSREIAEITGKRHDNVLRDCDILNENYEKLSLLKIEESTFKAENGQSYREYLLTRIQTFDLMTGYNVDLRIKVNRRWEELERTNGMLDFSNPDTVLRLAENWKKEHDLRLQKEKMLELAENTIEEQVPKVEYYDNVLNSKNLLTATQVGAEIGLTAQKFNNWLFAKGVQFKVRGQWVPAARYKDRGLMKSVSVPYKDSMGNTCTAMQSCWTQEGRKFVIDLWNKSNVKHTNNIPVL